MEWWDKGRGCFGGRDGGDCDDVERIIGGGRGGGESPAVRVVSRRECHCGGPLMTPANTNKTHEIINKSA